MITKKTLLMVCIFCFVNVSLINTVELFPKTTSSFHNNFKKLCKKPEVQAIMPLALIYSGIKTYKYSFILGTLLGKTLRCCCKEFGNLWRKTGIQVPWFSNQHDLPGLLQDLQEEGPKCCICSEALIASERMTLPCGHNDYHTWCLQRWLNERQICPICRTTVQNGT